MKKLAAIGALTAVLGIFASVTPAHAATPSGSPINCMPKLCYLDR